MKPDLVSIRFDLIQVKNDLTCVKKSLTYPSLDFAKAFLKKLKLSYCSHRKSISIDTRGTNTFNRLNDLLIRWTKRQKQRLKISISELQKQCVKEKNIVIRGGTLSLLYRVK
jgi:hypothetical protein